MSGRRPVGSPSSRDGGVREADRAFDVPRGRVGSRGAPALAVALLLSLAPAGAAAGQDVAVTGATVHPVSGPPVEGATVLVRSGVVEAVGRDVSVPAGVRRIDAAGKVVTPGFFDAGTRLGLIEVGAVSETRDYAMDVEEPMRAAFRVVDGINPNSSLLPVTRVAGVTTILSEPAGGVIAGQAAILDLLGSDVQEMLVRPSAAMVARFGPDPAGGSRGVAALRLRETLEDARFYSRNRDAFERGASRPLSQSWLDLEALQPVLAGETPLLVHVNRASDILAVLRIAEEYGLDLVVSGGAEAWMVADRLAAAQVPVIVKPLMNNPEDFSLLGARFDNAGLLERAGAPVVISTFDTHNARNLAWEAGNAVRYGLSREAALRAVTLAPAEAFGVADRYGSLAPGKVGNLVVWTGDPFELSSRAETVVIRGRVVPRSSRQDELYERYRSLEGERPPAYRGGWTPGEGGGSGDGG